MDFLHTVILFVILYIFLFSIYGTSNVVGSPGAMYDLLKKAADLAPVAGNAAGSYMTMKSNGGILFGGCTIGALSPLFDYLFRTDTSAHLQLLGSPASRSIRDTGNELSCVSTRVRVFWPRGTS